MAATVEHANGRRTIIEPARTLPVAYEADVVVLGGGVAGLTAGLAAARGGARVLLVERGNGLGGTATAGMMSLFYTPYSCAHGLAKEVFDRLIAVGGAFPGEVISVDHEAFKTVALEMICEAGVELLFHTICADVIMDGGRLAGLVVENKSGRGAVLGKVVVDASGDADVAARVGAPVTVGREEDHKMRPMSLLFRLGNVDVEAMLAYVRANPGEFSRDPNNQMIDLETGNIRLFGFFGLVESAKAEGLLYPECHYFRVEAVNPSRGTALVNTVRIYGVDGTNSADLTRAEVEGRRQQKLLVEFARRFVPGCKDAYVMDTASHIGVRETRRIVGSCMLTEEDILARRRFEDSIGIDSNRQNPKGMRHSPDGKEGSADDWETRETVAELFTYEIPYRCLLPQNVDGLLIAGRAISANHAADGYTRNQPACMITGQAAGTAAALAALSGVPPRAVPLDALQSRLRQLQTKLHIEELTESR